MSYFPKTLAAAGYAAEHARGALAHGRAGLLVRRLRACETVLDQANGQNLPAASGPLRDVVLAARDLVGPAWLDASADDPDVAAFTALESAPAPPASADLDEIVSRVLWARFAPRTVDTDATRQQARPGRGQEAVGTAR